MKQTLPAPTHRLGGEHAAVRRITAAADRVIGQAPSGRVSMAVLGDALAAPTGGRFDDADPDDRRLLARLLVVFGLRFQRFGFELRDVPPAPPPGALVVVDRRPQSAGMRAVSRLATWGDVAPRAELARFARRAMADDLTGVDDLGGIDLDGIDLDDTARPAAGRGEPTRLGRGLGDWDAVDRIRAAELAAGRPWPPEIRFGGERAERADPAESGARS